MKDYETYARKYPAIVSMVVPAFATAPIILYYLPQLQEYCSYIEALIGVFIPIGIVYGAIGYYIRQTFRDISKLLFQLPLFKEDETEMPTTKLLLWSSKKRLSNNKIQIVAAKVQKDFQIRLLNATEEEKDLIEAKKTIVDAVGAIREVTRDNAILLNYNIDFGFCRNYLGGAVCATILLLIAFLLNVFAGAGNWAFTLVLIFIQILLGLIDFITLKQKGYRYARALFDAYIGEHKDQMK